MGQMVEFAGNGSPVQGYLATPEGNGPGIVVIQEWWGLVDHIKDVCERFAAEGFVALAPDLYAGKSTKEPDEAGKLLMAMKIDDAGQAMSGAVDYLLAHERVEPKRVGSVGFCMGGNLALLVGTLKPLSASVAFYPYPFAPVDVAALSGPALAHIAEHDQAPSPAAADELAAAARAAGRTFDVHVYPGTDHAFFNDTRPETYAPDAATLAWERTLAFFRDNLR